MAHLECMLQKAVLREGFNVLYGYFGHSRQDTVLASWRKPSQMALAIVRIHFW